MYNERMKNVLITGGTEGIGRALADVMAARGYRPVLVARNREKLEHAAAEIKADYQLPAIAVQADLSQPGSAEKLYRKLQELEIRIDILVNNAGTGFCGRSWEIPVADEEAMVMLNDVAMMSLTKLYVRDMTARNEGMVLNIASMAAFQPGPYMAGYYASKAFVLSYSEALAEEVKGTGVYVVSYCPGQVDTGFLTKANSRRNITAITARQAAEQAYRALQLKQPVYIGRLFDRASLLIPRGVRKIILARIKRGE